VFLDNLVMYVKSWCLLGTKLALKKW
jgi:hypothetical protein